MKQQDKKKLLIIGGVAIGAFALYKVVSPKTDTSGSATDPTGNGGVPAGGTASFNAKAAAEKLYNAMKDMGTDEAAIFDALKNVPNDAYFSQVRAEFGKRSYNKTTGDQRNYNPFSSLPLENLPTWLKEELSATNYNILKKKYPQNLL